MSTISLRDYLSKIDQLLASNATDEVIHHCRHILQYFPKNVAVYRSLGRALVYSSRWDEAETVFRRVLGVYPDDVIAHIGLSEVYQNKHKMDDAIWHLERAFEQDPNDADVIHSLRDLYRRFRQIEQTKMQLTAPAVARQYVRSGLYQQAIDTLRASLDRTPDRMDLRVLLAQTLWASDHHVEAGEAALDVLETLPDCLEANRILTQLWLDEQRPSDAQHYLNRIEAVDPYIALELAEGKPASPDAFRLEELDYRHAAQRELASSRPSWLQEMGETGADAPQEDWASFLGSGADKKGVTGPAPTPIPAHVEDLSADLPDDWMLNIGGETTPAPQYPAPQYPAPQYPAPTPSPASLTEMPAAVSGGFTDFLKSLDNAPAASQPAASAAQPEADEIPDFSIDMPDLTAAPPAGSPSGGFTDFLKSMDAAPQGAAAQAAPAGDDLFSPEETPDWLRSAMPQEISPEASASPVEESELTPRVTSSPDSDADPLAWLRDSGVTIDEDAARQSLQEMSNDSAGDIHFQDPASNPLSWMEHYDDAVVNETGELPDLSQQPAAEADAEADPMAWLRSSGLELSDETAATPAAPENLAAQDDAHDWFGEQSAGAGEAPAELEWLSEPQAAETPAARANMPSADEELDWMRQFEEGQPAPRQMSEGIAPEAQTSPAEDDLSWMNQFDAQPAEAAPSETGSPTSFTGFLNEMDKGNAKSETAAGHSALHWLTESQPAQSSQAQEPKGGFTDSLNEIDVQPAERGQPSAEAPADESAMADMPDWLADVKPVEAPRTQGSVTDLLNKMDVALPDLESSGDDEPNWMSELGQPSAAPEPETPSAAGELGWMNDQEQPSAEPQKPDTGDEFSWMNDLEQPSAEPASETPGTDDEFSWMNDLSQPDADAEPEKPSAGDELSWMNDLGPSGGDAEPEKSGADAEFGWMNDMEDAKSESDAVTSVNEAGWLTGADEPEAPAAADAPDWLAELKPAAPPPQSQPPVGQPPPQATFTDFLRTIDTARKTGEMASASAGDDQPVQDNVPDWLAAVSGSGETDAAPEPPAQDESGYQWTDEEEEAQEPASADVPDWLSGIVKAQPEEAASPTPAVESPASEFDWLNAINDEPEPEPEKTPEPVEEPVSAPAASGQWFDFDGADSELVSAPDEEEATMSSVPAATNAPDWLNAMVPGLDVDFEAAEDEPIEQEFAAGDTAGGAHRSRERSAAGEARQPREFDWVARLVDEETRPPSKPARPPRFSFKRAPAWLRPEAAASAAAATSAAQPAAAEPMTATKPVEAVAEVKDSFFDDEFDDWLNMDDDANQGGLNMDSPKSDVPQSDEPKLDEPKAEDDDFDLPDWLK